MKKTIVLTILLLMLYSNANAATSEIVNGDFIQKSQNRIDKIGFRILNYNGIEKRTIFDYTLYKLLWKKSQEALIDKLFYIEDSIIDLNLMMKSLQF